MGDMHQAKRAEMQTLWKKKMHTVAQMAKVLAVQGETWGDMYECIQDQGKHTEMHACIYAYTQMDAEMHTGM